MQVNNNVQSPNFGMALKISKGAKRALKKLPMETIEKLQKAGADLKDTKFYHVEVGDNLSAKLKANKNAYFGLFKTKDYSANKHGVANIDGKFLVPDDRIIMVERNDIGTIAGVGRYVTHGKIKPLFNVWDAAGPVNDVNSINKLAKVAKILDRVAAEKCYQKVAGETQVITKKAKVSEAVDNLLDSFGV